MITRRHRFHAEFNVAALLAPFLLAAPDYEVQLLLATQVADEHRHIESVLRVYSDVFAVEGGIAAVKALADAQLDPVAAALYAALDGVVRALEARRTAPAMSSRRPAAVIGEVDTLLSWRRSRPSTAAAEARGAAASGAYPTLHSVSATSASPFSSTQRSALWATRCRRRRPGRTHAWRTPGPC